MTTSSSGPGPGMKTCPYCAEEIREAAVKCRYCQSDLDDPVPSTKKASSAPAAPTPSPTSAAQGSAAGKAAFLRRRPAATTTPTSRSEPAPTRFPALARPMVVIVLAVVVVIVLAANAFLVLSWHGYREQADARDSGQVTAVNDIEKILSYDYRTFDKGTKTAEALMTPKFKKKYADTVSAVRRDARPTKAVVKAQVVASSVVSAKKDKVKALLFVNQTTTRSNLKQPRVDLNRVEVTLVKSGDDWRVDNIQAL